jgi:hypothetical protein
MAAESERALPLGLVAMSSHVYPNRADRCPVPCTEMHFSYQTLLALVALS